MQRNYGLDYDLVSIERLDGETIVIDFQNGIYFNVKESGSDILFLISHKVARHAWNSILASAFNCPVIDEEVDSFLQVLLENGIAYEIDNFETEEIELPSDYVRGSWTKPTLFRFDDMQELLMIDPIHDASVDGWPNKAAE